MLTPSELMWLREIPSWMAVLIAVAGILLTYWEVRTANQRQIILRVWDHLHELDFSAGLEFPGVTPGSPVDRELRLLTKIHAHVGLLKDQPLKEAAYSVSKAWSGDYMKDTDETKSALTEAILNMTELMEPMTSFWRTYSLAPPKSSACRQLKPSATRTIPFPVEPRQMITRLANG